MVHEELELETPRHCFFGSIEETLERWQEGWRNVPEKVDYKIL